MLTLKGLRELEKMKSKPRGWKALVMNYLSFKEHSIANMHEQGKDTLEQELAYIEALEIAKRMGILWKPTMSR